MPDNARRSGSSTFADQWKMKDFSASLPSGPDGLSAHAFAQRGNDPRNNATGSGSSSPSPLPQYTEAFDSGQGERDTSKSKNMARKADDPTLERRGLAPEVKSAMIEMFARFQSVSHIADMLKRDFSLTLDRRTIEAFNPDSHRCRIGKRLKSLFELQRKAYVEECAKVGVSHQAHRLRLIGQIVEKAEKAKDFGNALKGLELAAKEMGGFAQVVEHKGTVAHVHGTVEDARRELADRLKALVPVVDLPSRDITAEPCDITKPALPKPDGSTSLQAVSDEALATRATPMADRIGRKESARTKARGDEAS